MKAKRPKSCKVWIRGHWWRIIRKVPPQEPEALGLCVYEDRIIYLKPGCELPATLIHEAIHAAVPDLDETAVEAAEEAVMNCLVKWGLLVHDPETHATHSA